MGLIGVLLFLAQTLHPADVTTTTKLDVAPGSTIRIVGSEGELNIEAWDQPRVEMTVSRYTYTDNGKDKVLDRIPVEAKKTGANEVTITTSIAGRNPLTRAIHGLTAVDIDYQIRVPRDSNLIIRHGSGDVVIQGVSGNIEAHAGDAEIVAFLPDPGNYSIHAKATFGTVYSDYQGVWKHVFPLGMRFASNPAPAAKNTAKNVDLETGNGGITIGKSADTVLTSSR